MSKQNKEKDTRSCCEKVPDDYITLKDFLTQSDDSNKLLGSMSKIAMFLVEVAIVLIVVLAIIVFIFSKIHFSKNELSICIILTIFSILSCCYYLLPIIYTSKSLYLLNIKRLFITSIILCILHILLTGVGIYMIFRNF